MIGRRNGPRKHGISIYVGRAVFFRVDFESLENDGMGLGLEIFEVLNPTWPTHVSDTPR